MARRQRPATARAAADGMKLHRRSARLDGRTHAVIGLRPGTTARFSTNFFHETWHVLSDRHGARLLARLLWGLSYQARPGTILMIDRPFLAPTPFDADPADPVVVIPGWLTFFGDRAARDLNRRLPLTVAPEGTVRWRTYGLDVALTDPQGWVRENSPRWMPEHGGAARRGGLIVLTAPSARVLREWAVCLGGLDVANEWGMDHAYLGPWPYTGEVQVFAEFHRMVSVARRARAEVLARPGGAPEDPQRLREAVWHRVGAVARR
jgi:hypothetical protein